MNVSIKELKDDSKIKKESETDIKFVIDGVGQRELPSNIICTSKYQPWNFIFFNLFYQFTKSSNLYFVFIGILQTLKSISLTGGVPIIYGALAFIILVSMIKDLVESMNSWKSDGEENSAKVEVWKDNNFVKCFKKDILVGSVVRVSQDEIVPSDIILLQTDTRTSNICWIETKQLDGETNLKQKTINSDLLTHFKDPSTLVNSMIDDKCSISYEKANNSIYTFRGSLNVRPKTESKSIGLDNSNILLRGSVLRNNKWVVG